MSNCHGCRVLNRLDYADKVPVYLEPAIRPADLNGNLYICLACGSSWVDVPPSPSMIPRFQPLEAALARKAVVTTALALIPPKPIHWTARDIQAAG
ncbi:MULTISPECIES: hypothetical protein [Hydrocarboniphaga]|nr:MULTISPECIES: hypothetical protein [Hydrocarboniphaga]MDZ4077412.1 hypothetical protein [Hydrocarboniphaga sp.]